jgi:hypothetical protein
MESIELQSNLEFEEVLKLEDNPKNILIYIMERYKESIKLYKNANLTQEEKLIER